MADSIPNLWSDDISTDVLSPIAVLRSQAGLLGRMTKGLLEAEVTTQSISNISSGENDKTEILLHNFDLIAPALNRSRYRIMAVRHDAEMVYPATVEAEIFEPGEYDEPGTWSWPNAYSESEFIQMVGQVLKSAKVKSTLQSLIARSNEKRPPTTASSETEKEDKRLNPGNEDKKRTSRVSKQ
jgi:hypothetical protein